MYTFFKSRPVQPVVVIAAKHPPEYYTLRRQYVHLCTHNTHYSGKQAGLDFEALMLDERVSAITVNPAESMLIIGTHEVLIPFNGETYRIGSFIIKIAMQTREWVKDYRTHLHFERVTGHAIDHETEHLHPHINHVGRICMTDGLSQLGEAASNGDFLTAARIALTALWRVDYGNTFRPIKEWPTVQGGSNA